MSPASTPYKRILLKLSGEALMGEGKYGIHPPTLVRIAGEVRELVQAGVQVAMVIGGGNIFRGVAGATEGMDRSAADFMGMLATVINSMAMQDALEKQDVVVRTQTALAVTSVAEPYIRRRAMRHLEKGRVAYAVLSFRSSLGMGEKLFATPFEALKLDASREHFTLDIDQNKLKNAPGFDKNHPPQASDRTWGAEVYKFYGIKPYWQ